MERYCISDKVYEKLSTNTMNLKIHTQTLMELAKNVNFGNAIQQKNDPKRDRMVALLSSSLNSQTGESFNRIDNENKVKSDFFSECNGDILALYNVDSFASSEEEMYETILANILQPPFLYIDISLHIYYTILYQKNKGKYINLLQNDWTKEEKENFRNQRKSCKAYNKKTDGLYIPFEIKEDFAKCIQIQDFAPNMVRLYYSSREFRNIFSDTRAADTEKYYLTKIMSVYQSPNIDANRVEEIWLLERILGINLAREFYSLVSQIMPQNFSLVKSEYQPLIIEIVHEIIKFPGIYSRCLLVHKLKEIVKIRRYGHEIEQSEPYEMMVYLQQILKNCINSISEEFRYQEYKEYQKLKKTVTEETLDSLKNKCNKLLNNYFHMEKEYYILNGNERFIDNEGIYSLIQKAIINELKM